MPHNARNRPAVPIPCSEVTRGSGINILLQVERSLYLRNTGREDFGWLELFVVCRVGNFVYV